MQRLLGGLVLVGVATSVAVMVRDQLKDNEAPAKAQSSAPVTEAPALPNVSAQATADTADAGNNAPAPKPAASPVTATPAPTTEAPARPAAEQPEDTQETGATVLKSASAAYSAVRSLKADFTQKRTNPLLGSTSTSRGTLYQKRPDRFLMKFSDPAGDVIVSDGEYFWVYYPSADKRQVLRAPASENGAGGVDLQAQFLGDPLKRFTHTYHGRETLNGRSAHVITLVPRSNLGYKSLKVWIDAKDYMTRRFVLTENNGVVQEYTLSNLSLNPTLPAELFRFTPPADARIIDRP